MQIILVFIDFLKAFDSLYQEAMGKILLAHELPPKIVNMIKTLYAVQFCTAQTEHGLSEGFLVESGVRQECLISRLISNILYYSQHL